jgi:hypothetical protein
MEVAADCHITRDMAVCSPTLRLAPGGQSEHLEKRKQWEKINGQKARDCASGKYASDSNQP